MLCSKFNTGEGCVLPLPLHWAVMGMVYTVSQGGQDLTSLHISQNEQPSHDISGIPLNIPACSAIAQWKE